MINRRNIIKLGIGGVATPLIVNTSFATESALPDPAFHILMDNRFPESRAFAETMQTQGAAVYPLEGDLGSQWYENLRNLMMETPRQLAGLTDQHTLFCLEELARDVGLKVTYRADFLTNENGNVRQLAGLQAQKRNGPRADSIGNLLVSWVME